MKKGKPKRGASSLERLIAAAQHVLKIKIHEVRRDDWESRVRLGGKPTVLNGPFETFSAVQRRAPVVMYAMSTPPQANPGGFHIVRHDAADAPNVINTDSYDEIDIAAQDEWPRILSAAKLTEEDVEWILCTYVFVTGPKRRSDHHSPEVPRDIANAKRNGLAGAAQLHAAADAARQRPGASAPPASELACVSYAGTRNRPRS